MCGQRVFPIHSLMVCLTDAEKTSGMEWWCSCHSIDVVCASASDVLEGYVVVAFRTPEEQKVRFCLSVHASISGFIFFSCRSGQL